MCVIKKACLGVFVPARLECTIFQLHLHSTETEKGKHCMCECVCWISTCTRTCSTALLTATGPLENTENTSVRSEQSLQISQQNACSHHPLPTTPTHNSTHKLRAWGSKARTPDLLLLFADILEEQQFALKKKTANWNRLIIGNDYLCDATAHCWRRLSMKAICRVFFCNCRMTHTHPQHPFARPPASRHT